MAKVGRKTKLTPEIIDTIHDIVSTGVSINKACEQAGVSYSIYWLRVNKDPELFETSMRAREAGTHAKIDECIDIADDPKIETGDKRIMIDTRLRVAGKLNPKNYGEKKIVSGDSENPLQLNVNKKSVDLSDEELLKIATKDS